MFKNILGNSSGKQRTVRSPPPPPPPLPPRSARKNAPSNQSESTQLPPSSSENKEVNTTDVSTQTTVPESSSSTLKESLSTPSLLTSLPISSEGASEPPISENIQEPKEETKEIENKGSVSNSELLDFLKRQSMEIQSLKQMLGGQRNSSSQESVSSQIQTPSSPRPSSTPKENNNPPPQPTGIPITSMKAINTSYSNTTIQSMISTFNSINDQNQKKLTDLEAIIATYQKNELLYKERISQLEYELNQLKEQNNDISMIKTNMDFYSKTILDTIDMTSTTLLQSMKSLETNSSFVPSSKDTDDTVVLSDKSLSLSIRQISQRVCEYICNNKEFQQIFQGIVKDSLSIETKTIPKTEPIVQVNVVESLPKDKEQPKSIAKPSTLVNTPTNPFVSPNIHVNIPNPIKNDSQPSSPPPIIEDKPTIEVTHEETNQEENPSASSSFSVKNILQAFSTKQSMNSASRPETPVHTKPLVQSTNPFASSSAPPTPLSTHSKTLESDHEVEEEEEYEGSLNPFDVELKKKSKTLENNNESKEEEEENSLNPFDVELKKKKSTTPKNSKEITNVGLQFKNENLNTLHTTGQLQESTLLESNEEDLNDHALLDSDIDFDVDSLLSESITIVSTTTESPRGVNQSQSSFSQTNTNKLQSKSTQDDNNSKPPTTFGSSFKQPYTANLSRSNITKSLDSKESNNTSKNPFFQSQNTNSSLSKESSFKTKSSSHLSDIKDQDPSLSSPNNDDDDESVHSLNVSSSLQSRLAVNKIQSLQSSREKPKIKPLIKPLTKPTTILKPIPNRFHYNKGSSDSESEEDISTHIGSSNQSLKFNIAKKHQGSALNRTKPANLKSKISTDAISLLEQDRNSYLENKRNGTIQPVTKIKQSFMVDSDDESATTPLEEEPPSTEITFQPEDQVVLLYDYEYPEDSSVQFHAQDTAIVNVIEDEWTYITINQYDFWIPTNYLELAPSKSTTVVKPSTINTKQEQTQKIEDSSDYTHISCYSISEFNASSHEELSVVENQHLYILKTEDEWAYVEDEDGNRGLVPLTFLEEE